MDERIRKIADAVLYEGYILYPYRASAIKNKRRFDLGVLEPNDSFSFQIPVVGETPEIKVTLRFLRLSKRENWLEGEAIDHEFQIGSERIELERRFEKIEAKIEAELHSRTINSQLLSIKITNVSTFKSDVRDEVLLRSLVAAHAVAEIERGEFVSLLEPPEEFAELASGCVNKGVFPVLVGDRGRRNTVFASPVILYDFPGVAPESAGDMFDGAEIDELLTLRIQTMTDAEKREMAATDARAAALLKRVENLSDDELFGLHGRLSTPSKFNVGDRVRLKPRDGGDALDVVLAGRTAIVEAVETDFENRVHLAVVIEDDPGRDFGFERMPGHRFFYFEDEVESL